MDNKTTLKVWVTKSDFSRIQEGTYPNKVETTMPENVLEFVEMTVSMKTLTEWALKHKNPVKPNKNLLFG